MKSILLLMLLLNNLLASPDTTYFDNGQLRKITDYEGSANNHGYKKTWYKNGQQRMISYFKDGERDSSSTRWFKNGQIKDYSFIRNKKQNDWVMHWDSTGLIQDSSSYNNGNMVESFAYYWGTTQLRARYYYGYDKKTDKELIIMMDSYDKEGRMISQIRNGKGNFVVVEHYKHKPCESHKKYAKGILTLESYHRPKDKPDCSPMKKTDVLPWDVGKYGVVK